MTQRTQLLVVLGMAACALLLVAWLLVRGSDDATLPDLSAATTTASSGAAGSAADAVGAEVAEAGDAHTDATLPRSRTRGDAASHGGLAGRLRFTDQAPIAHAEVAAWRSNHSMWHSPYRVFAEAEPPPPATQLATTRTAADGRFGFADLPVEIPLLLVLAPRTGRATVRFVERSPRPGETVDLGDLLLARGSGLSGRVVDTAGQPLAAVRVRIVDAQEHLEFGAGMDRFAGSGAIALVDQRTEESRVQVLSGVPLVSKLFTSASAGAERVFAVDAALQSWRVRAERVATPGSATFAARSMPTWSAPLERELALPTTTTDTDGRFTFEGAAATRLTLWLDRSGYEPLRAGPFHARDGGARDLGTLVLAAARALQGEVVDARGQPIPGAEVLAGPADGPEGLRFLVPAGRTDAAGRFAADAPHGGAMLLAARRGLEDAWHTVGPIEVTDTVARIALPDTPALQVTVQSAEGKPVPEVELRVTSAVRTRAGQGRFLPLKPAVPIERTAADGFHLRRLPPEPVRILATVPGFVPAALRWQAEAPAARSPGADAAASPRGVAGGNSPTEVRLTLAPAATGLLRVVRAGADEPLAEVRAVASPEVFGAAAALFPLADPFVLGTSDARGTIALRHLPAGTHTVLLHHPRLGWTKTQVTLPGEPTTVRFDLPGSLAGRVLDGTGPPRSPVRVALRSEGDLPVQEEGHWILVPVAGDGSFHVADLTPGAYLVTAAFDPGHVSSMHFHLDLAISSSGMADVEATVHAGKETQVVLQLREPQAEVRSGRIHGHVHVDGQPAPDLEVTLEGDHELQTLTEESGTFEFPRVPADADFTLRVAMRTPDQGSVVLHGQAVRVAAGQALEVRVTVDLARLTLRVVHATNGTALPQLRVRVVRGPTNRGGHGGDDQESTYGGTTDAQGLVTLCVPAGTYTPSSAGRGFAAGKTERITVPRGATEARLPLFPSVRVAGRVELAGGVPNGCLLEFRGRATGHAQNVGVRPNKDRTSWTFRSGDLPADTYEVSLRPRKDCAAVELLVAGPQSDAVLRFQVGSGGR